MQKTSSQNNTSMTDPIVFDMSGNGITLTSLAQSTAYFDLRGTGVAEHTGWIGPTTGLLVSSPDPTSIGNLFGNSSVDGFTALQALAGSGHTVINASTPGWSSLYVWQDANGNGVADTGEVKSLTALGITSVSLQATPVNETINGNTISEVATFTSAGGATHQVAEAFFNNSNLDTIYTGSFTLNPATLTLPDLRGYGNTKDLYIAMSLDPALLTLVKNFAAQTASAALGNLPALFQQVTTIIYEWTGVTSVNPASRGPYVNAQQLEAIESMVGEPYVSTLNGVSSPNPQDAHLGQTFEGAWQTFFNATAARLLVQGPLASVFPEVQYNYGTDDFVGVMNVGDVASAIAKNSPTALLPASQYWQEMITVTDTVATAIGVSTTQLNTALQTAFSGLKIPSLTWAEVQPGNYVFGTGGGHVSYQVYQDTPGVLTLGAGITASNITLQADSSGDLTVSLSTGDSITFQNDLTALYDPLGLAREGTGSVISQIAFANGTSLQLNEPSQPLVFTYNTSASNTSLTATTLGDSVFNLLGASGDTVSDAGVNGTVMTDNAASSGNSFTLTSQSTAAIGGTHDTVNISNNTTTNNDKTAVSITGSYDAVNINSTGYYDVIGDTAAASHNTIVDDSAEGTMDTLNGAYDTITLENITDDAYAGRLTVNSAGNNQTVNLAANTLDENVTVSGSNTVVNEAAVSEENHYTLTGAGEVLKLQGFFDTVTVNGTTDTLNISGSNSWNNLPYAPEYFALTSSGQLEIILTQTGGLGANLNAGAQTTITGDNGSIIVSNISNSTLSYAAGSKVYIGGTKDTVNLANNNVTVTTLGSEVFNLSGTGGNATVSGTGQTATVTDTGTSNTTTVAGTSNTVSYTGNQNGYIGVPALPISSTSPLPTVPPSPWRAPAIPRI